jgi:hypothetical protein
MMLQAISPDHPATIAEHPIADRPEATCALNEVRGAG